MRVVKQWTDWKLFCNEDGAYQLTRYDHRNQIKTLQIKFTAANDDAAIVEAMKQTTVFEKKKTGPASHINRLK